MARTQAKILASIWTDDDWLALSGWSRLLYLAVLSQPRLSLAGCIDVMPGRWATFIDPAADPHDVADCLGELVDARFVVVDGDEAVLRSFTRHDLAVGAVNVNLVKGFWSAWAGIRSGTLRKVVIDNLPDSIWDRSPDSVPDQATELRSEPRLELPLEPRSRPESEPSVDLLPADCSLPPAVLLPATDNGSENRSDREPAPDAGAVVVDEQAVNRALLHYSRAVVAATPNVDSPDGLAASIRRDADADGVLDDLRGLLAEGLTPEAAGSARAGRSAERTPLAPSVPAADSVHPLLRSVPTFCGECDDGWLLPMGAKAAARCACNPDPIAAVSGVGGS